MKGSTLLATEARRALDTAMRTAEAHRRARRGRGEVASTRVRVQRLARETQELSAEARSRVEDAQRQVLALRARAAALLAMVNERRAPAIVAAPADHDSTESGSGANTNDSTATTSRVQQVLIVEDHDDTRELFEMGLAQFEFKVRTAQSGPEALALLDETQDPCVIVTDLVMPEMSGLELVAAVREHPVHAQSHVIILTAASSIPAPPGCVVLFKPVSIRTLVAAIRGEATDDGR